MSEDNRTVPKSPKPYQPPKVVDYGSTSKLSATKPGTSADGTNPLPKICL